MNTIAFLNTVCAPGNPKQVRLTEDEELLETVGAHIQREDSFMTCTILVQLWSSATISSPC